MMKYRCLAVLAVLGHGVVSLPARAIDAGALPKEGVVASGQASIAVNGGVMNIKQNTDRAIINWKGFDVGANAVVNFQQPSASSAILNRVTSGGQSVIDGSMNANGQVYLINPNGVLFGKGAQVNTGGLVASTHGITDENFNTGRDVFTRDGATGVVQNDGTITIQNSGKAVLIAPTVKNNGTVTASGGNIVFAAGEKVTLAVGAGGALQVEVEGAQLNSSIENAGTLAADGGSIILSSKTATDSLSSVVANTGVIQARTLANKQGRIVLEAGNVSLSGTVDASAPGEGDGGFVQVATERMDLGKTVNVSTKAAQGSTGSLTLNAQHADIAESGGLVTATQLTSLLANTNVEVKSLAGDLTVSDPTYWQGDTVLTLSALGDIRLRKYITVAGNRGGLVLNPGAGRDYILDDGVTVKFFSPQSTLSIAGNRYTILRSVAELASATDGYYALAGNFAAFKSTTPSFKGSFAGLGNSLDVNNPLYGVLENNSIVRDLTLKSSVGSSDQSYVAPLAVSNFGTVRHVSFTGNVYGAHHIGGVVVTNQGTIDSAKMSGNMYVYGNMAGGIAAENLGTIINSTAATVIERKGDGGELGGLVGINRASGMIRDSFANFSIYVHDTFGIIRFLGNNIGGFAGSNEGEISRSGASVYMPTHNHASSFNVGGFVGNNNGYISYSYADGWIFAYDGASVGGFAGSNAKDIRYCYSTTDALSNGKWVGGFSGRNEYGAFVGFSYATGLANGGQTAGAMAAYNDGYMTQNYAIGAVKGNNLGGFVASTNNAASQKTDDSFWDVTTSKQYYSWGNAQGRTTDQLLNIATYWPYGWDINGDPNGTSTWYMRAGNYPVLRGVGPQGKLTLLNIGSAATDAMEDAVASLASTFSDNDQVNHDILENDTAREDHRAANPPAYTELHEMDTAYGDLVFSGDVLTLPSKVLVMDHVSGAESKVQRGRGR